MYSLNINALFVNDTKTKLYIESLKNKEERFFGAIEALCEYGKPVLAAEIVGGIRHGDGMKIKKEAGERIYRYLNRGESDIRVMVESLLLLGYRDKIVSLLNGQQFEEIKDVLVGIIDYHQEKSDYDIVYDMLDALSLCEDMSFLRYVLFYQRGKGLYIYNDDYIGIIQDIVYRVWNRGAFDIVVSIQKLLWGGKNFFDKLGLSEDELLEALLNDDTSTEKIRIALYYIQDGKDDNEAYMVLLKRLRKLKDTDAVRLQRWSYMFKAYRENLIDYETLNDYLLDEKKRAIPNLKNDYGVLYFTTRIFVKLASEGNWPYYHELKRNMGYNNVFFPKNVSEVLPHTVYKNFENQEKIEQAAILEKRYINDRRKQKSNLEMYKFYMNSHFKYVVKLRFVLDMLKGKNLDEIYDWKLHLKVLEVTQHNDKKIIYGRIRDCMTEKVNIIVPGYAEVKEDKTYLIKMKNMERGYISYESICVNGTEIPILRNSLNGELNISDVNDVKNVNEEKYDELLLVLEKIKTESVTDEIIDRVRALSFEADGDMEAGVYTDSGFASGFTKSTAEIISTFAGKPDLLRQIKKLIEVLNDKKVNIYEYSKEWSEKRNKAKSKRYIRYYNATFDAWRTIKYSEMTAEEEMSVKKDMVWVFMNSYLRAFYSADDLLRLICSKKITQREGFSRCFEDFVFCGVLYKSGYDSGSIYPISVYLDAGCRFCYEEDDYQAYVLPDRAKVLFRLKRFRSGDVFVRELHEETESYVGEYEYLVEMETLNSVMDEFKKSGLDRKYTYTKLLLDWCNMHRPGETVCTLPYSRSFVFEEAYVRALQKNEMIEIQGLKDDSDSEDGSRMLILSEFDIKNKILSFEIFE